MTTNIGRLEATVGLNTAGLRADMARADGLFRQFSNKAGRSIGGLASQVGVLGAAFGGIAATGGGIALFVGTMRSAIKVGAEFENTMATVGGVMRATASELDALTASAKYMGETTEFTASQAGEALRFLGMAGFDAEKAIAALPGTLDLATAGQLDLGRAADIATNALTAMGLDVEELGRVNDVMVATATRSNTTVNEMAEAFQYAAPFAAAYGYNIEELSGFIGMLANAGVKGTMAGTALRRAMVEASKIAGEFGYKSQDLVDVIEDLSKAGYTAQQIMDLFQDRAGVAAGIIARNVTQTKKFQEELGRTSGEAQRLADKMRSTLVGQFRELQSVLEGIKIDIFVRMRDRLEGYLRAAIEWFRKNKEAIIDFADRAMRAIEAFVKTVGTLLRPVADAVGIIGALFGGIQDGFEGAGRAARDAADVIGQSLDDIKADVMLVAVELQRVRLAMVDTATAIATPPSFSEWDKLTTKLKAFAHNAIEVGKFIGRVIGLYIALSIDSVSRQLEAGIRLFVEWGQRMWDAAKIIGKRIWAAVTGQGADVDAELYKQLQAVLKRDLVTVGPFQVLMADIERFGKTLNDEWDKFKANLERRSPEEILTEEWVQPQEERLKRLGEQAEALRRALANLSSPLGGVRTDKDPGGIVEPKKVKKVDPSRILAEQIALNAQALQSYETLFSIGKLTAGKLRALWEDYKRARLRQIELEVRAMAEAGANAMQMVLFVRASQAQLNEDMKQLYASQGTWLDRWAREVADNMRAAFANFFFEAMRGEFETLREAAMAFARAIGDSIAAEIARRAGIKLVDLLSRGAEIAFNIATRSNNVVPEIQGPPTPIQGPPTPKAAGGLVTQPTLALIGDNGPEMVMPLNKRPFLDNISGGGNTFNFIVNTNDAAAFERSRGQIMTDAALFMERARRNR